MDYEIVLLLMFAAACAGFVDSIAGGGGLITLPALLLSGLTPVEAVATNKLQGTFGVAAATAGFARAGHIEFKSLAPLVAATGAGAALGALLVGTLDQQALAAAMPFALIAVAIYFALAPRLRRKATSAPLSLKVFALAVAAPIGFYDGFFGPGTGSLFALGFVSLMGLGLLQATANTKVLNLTSNLVSLCDLRGDRPHRLRHRSPHGSRSGSRSLGRSAHGHDTWRARHPSAAGADQSLRSRCACCSTAAIPSATGFSPSPRLRGEGRGEGQQHIEAPASAAHPNPLVMAEPCFART